MEIKKKGFTLAEGATHVGTSNTKRKFAFTLAEVLITLGIIGVVSVLTIPNIISNYQKKVYVTQLQKAYNQISNALELLMSIEEVDNLNDTSLFCEDDCDDAKKKSDFVAKYFKVTKNCLGHYEDPNCVVDNYKRLDGSTSHDWFSSYVTLKSGMSMAFWLPNRNKPLDFAIDVNGVNKGPNVWGRDAFAFDINYKGEMAESFMYYPNHLDPEINYLNDPNRCFNNEIYGGGCLTKIINDGWVMDY